MVYLHEPDDDTNPAANKVTVTAEMITKAFTTNPQIIQLLTKMARETAKADQLEAQIADLGRRLDKVLETATAAQIRHYRR